jgi:N-acetylglucosamine malate deacetylase 1
MNVLVAAPHPDDDLIGCGGSMIGHLRKRRKVNVIYLTSGDSGSIDIPKSDLQLLRENEAREAASLLGIQDLIFLRNEDGYLQADKRNLIEMVKRIREIRPAWVYIPHRGEAHPDHRMTHNLMIEAIRRASGPWFQECGGEPWTVGTVLCYEVWSPLQNISYTENITDFIDLKLAALRKHASQIKNTAYDEAAEALNRYRGIVTGEGRYCECFEVISTSNMIEG